MADLFFLAALPGSAGAATFVVVSDDMTFGSPPPRLHVGDVIEWINRDIFRHSATAADGSFDVDLEPHAKARTTLKTPGHIDFTCRFHLGMKGSFEVAP